MIKTIIALLNVIYIAAEFFVCGHDSIIQALPDWHSLVQQVAELKVLLNICETHTYINNRLNTTYFLHLLCMYSSCQSEVLPVTMKHEQQALLKLFLIMCTSVKALLRDIEYSFNVGYLVLVLQQGIWITDYCWITMLKIAVTTILTHVCDLLPWYSYRPAWTRWRLLIQSRSSMLERSILQCIVY